jgi:cytochrome c oxidase cbb3-type subunit 2/cytochrome c oxidase cbb3-type subunit I/II
MILPHFEPELPVAPGRGAFMVVCVSCHSARYVTMQPLFPERQWKETVDKMVKVYGAQMDAQQRELIVQYLVKIHGPDSAPAGPPADDEIGDSVTAAVPAVNPAEPAPLLKLAESTPDREEEIQRGADVFKQNCAGCHGSAGKGDGWIAPVLSRKPKDLSATRFSLQALSDALWNGKPGTTMPSWRALPQTNLTSLAAYVQSLYQPANIDVQASSELLQQGDRIFQQNCAVCHGAHGEGNGPASATLSPAPANFKLKQPNPDYLLRILIQGIPGTAMPSWNQQIPDSDRNALVFFVRSLFDPREN